MAAASYFLTDSGGLPAWSLADPPLSAPGVPTTLASLVTGGSTVTLSLIDTNAGSAQYRWQIAPVSTGVYADASGGTNPEYGSSYNATGLSPATEYSFRVRGENLAGNSAYVVAGFNFWTDNTGGGIVPIILLLLPSQYVNTNTFYAHVINSNTTILTAGYLVNNNSFPVSSISINSIGYTLQIPLLVNSNNIAAPIILGGRLVVTSTRTYQAKPRNSTSTAVKSSVLGRFDKQPREVLDFDIIYGTDALPAGDSIVNKSIEVSPAGLTVSSLLYDVNKIKVLTEAGVQPTLYKVTVLASTLSGLVLEDEVHVQLEDI